MKIIALLILVLSAMPVQAGEWVRTPGTGGHYNYHFEPDDHDRLNGRILNPAFQGDEYRRHYGRFDRLDRWDNRLERWNNRLDRHGYDHYNGRTRDW